MIEWIRYGEETLQRPGLDPKERAQIEAHLKRMDVYSRRLKVNQNQRILKQTIAEYKRDLTPDSVTKFWRAMLPDLSIPGCDWTVEAIQSPMKDIKGHDVPGILVPDVDKITLPLLGRMYPKMRSYAVGEKTPITDTHETRGYVKVYALVDVPNKGTTQGELEEFAQEQGYFGGRLRTYILASQASKVLTGKYLDQENTWARLFGSRSEGSVIDTAFDSDGILRVYCDLYPQTRYPGWGCRLEEVKKV